MRELILKMSISVDGFVAGPNGELDWAFKSFSRAWAEWQVETLWNASVHIMGSRTFRDMQAWWPKSDEAFAAPMNGVAKLVFSREGAAEAGKTTHPSRDAAATAPAPFPVLPEVAAKQAEWDATQILAGDLATHITALKRGDGKPILAHGGAGFAQSLIATGLIDEYRLVVHPAALGRGLSIFTGLPRPAALDLVASKSFPKGIVANLYRPA